MTTQQLLAIGTVRRDCYVSAGRNCASRAVTNYCRQNLPRGCCQRVSRAHATAPIWLTIHGQLRLSASLQARDRARAILRLRPAKALTGSCVPGIAREFAQGRRHSSREKDSAFVEK